MDKKEELQNTIDTARAELFRIEQVEGIAKAKEFVGRCFKYRNCYSMPQDESDYWWKYRYVHRQVGGDLYSLTFEKCSNNTISIIPDDSIAPYHFAAEKSGNWQEISSDEFSDAWAKLLREIEDIDMMVDADQRQVNRLGLCRKN
jgi:hypothetical protein